jgi:hypothetical protein
LAKLGYSRDGKKGTLQVNYGLLTNAQGIPVAVSVFVGPGRDSPAFPGRARRQAGARLLPVSFPSFAGIFPFVFFESQEISRPCPSMCTSPFFELLDLRQQVGPRRGCFLGKLPALQRNKGRKAE